MITLIVTLQIKPDRLFDFIDATRIARDRTLINETGCKAYTINQGTNDNEIVLVEVYEGNTMGLSASMPRTALDEHKDAHYFIDWKRTTNDMILGKTVTSYISIQDPMVQQPPHPLG